MKALHENDLISIVLNGEIRKGRVRLNHTRAELQLYVGGRGRGLTPHRLNLDQLSPTTEGIKWARGWNTEAAKALAVSLALDDKTEVAPKIKWGSALKTGLSAVAAKDPKAGIVEGFKTFLGGVLADIAFQAAKSAPPILPALPPSTAKPRA